MTFNKTIKKSLAYALMSSMLAVPLLFPETVEAASPTLTLAKTYNSTTNEVSVKATSNGLIELPGGNTQSSSSTNTVKKNGVYAYSAQLDGEVITKSIHVEEIKSTMLIVNNPNVFLELTYKDNLSGISKMRFKNESTGTWTDWRNTKSTTSNGTEKISWTFDTTKEGIRTVYAQFQDQAGNITPGEPYDRITYDKSGPNFTTTRQKYYVKETSFKLFVTGISDTYSTPVSVSVSVDGAGYVTYPLKDYDFSSGVNIPIPASKRTAGEKDVQVKMTDNLGNESAPKSVKVYYDATLPDGAIDVTKRNGSALEKVETGRIWESNTGSDEYGFFPEVILSESREISLNLNLTDAHSGIFRKNDGIALVEVVEMDIETDKTGKVVKEKEIKRTTYTNVPSTGKLKVDWMMDYGLEKRMDIVIQDNAGNRTLVKGTPIYLSALNLVHFKVTEVVNPKNEWEPVEWNTETKPAEVLSGGNVAFELMYSLLSANDPVDIYGSVEIKTTLPKTAQNEGYDNLQYLELTKEGIQKDKAKPYFNGYFTVPADAPLGAEVYVQGWLTAEFENGQKLRIHFPTKNASIYQKIGVVTGNIQDMIQFNAIR